MYIERVTGFVRGSGARADEHRGDICVLRAVLRGAGGTMNIERRRKRIGLCGRAGDGCGGENAFGGMACTGVDKVTIAAAFDLEELRAGARGAQGLVAKNNLTNIFISPVWVGNANRP